MSGNVTLNGGGTLLLSSADRLRGSGILTNVNNTIQGETNSGGSLGMNEIGIINQAGGVIDANLTGLALVVDPNSADGLLNQGLMRASNGGILLLTGSNGGGFTNNNLILATGAGSEVQLTSGASIFGGTLSTASGGLFRNLNSATLSGLANTGAFFANNGTTTTLIGTITNSGSLTIGSTGSFTDLSLAGSVTLTGSGILNLSSADRVRGNGILTNVNNTIQGETNGGGSLGTNEIGIVNQGGGLIDANASGLALVIDPNSADGLSNQGLMRASNGGILLLTGGNGGGFDNTGGMISALTGSEVRLTSGAFVLGGTLNTAGTGFFRNQNNATLSNLTLAGAFIADNGTSTTLLGTITNTGSITINSTGSFTDLFLSGDLNLTGGGLLTLSSADRVRGNGNLINANNTIQGETNNGGSLGNNEIGIVNQTGGLINANVNGLFLLVDPDAANGLINLGIMQASNGGLLRLGGGVFNNSGGVIQALNGSEVQILGGTSFMGGTLNTSGTGVIRTLGNSATFANLTNAGVFRISNGTDATFLGTINNTGNIIVNATGNFTDFIVNGNLTLQGGGMVTLMGAGQIRGGGTLFIGGPMAKRKPSRAKRASARQPGHEYDRDRQPLRRRD